MSKKKTNNLRLFEAVLVLGAILLFVYHARKYFADEYSYAHVRDLIWFDLIYWFLYLFSFFSLYIFMNIIYGLIQYFKCI